MKRRIVAVISIENAFRVQDLQERMTEKRIFEGLWRGEGDSELPFSFCSPPLSCDESPRMLMLPPFLNLEKTIQEKKCLKLCFGFFDLICIYSCGHGCVISRPLWPWLCYQSTVAIPTSVRAVRCQLQNHWPNFKISNMLLVKSFICINKDQKINLHNLKNDLFVKQIFDISILSLLGSSFLPLIV